MTNEADRVMRYLVEWSNRRERNGLMAREAWIYFNQENAE